VNSNQGVFNLYYQATLTSGNALGRIQARLNTYTPLANPDDWHKPPQKNNDANHPLLAGNDQIFSDAVGEFTGLDAFQTKHWRMALARTVDSSANSLTRARWYQFLDVTTTIIASGSLIEGEMTTNPDTAGAATYIPAVDYTVDNNMYVTYMQSSATQFPGMYIAGLRSGARPANQLELGSVGGTSFPGQLQAGTSALVGYPTTDSLTYRVGDYAAAMRDPDNLRAVWVANEYASSAAAPNWGTAIAQIAVADQQTDHHPAVQEHSQPFPE
jgi:hypothetical protein